MNTNPLSDHPAPPSRQGGFSFVEMLASVAIIGIIAFLAIPSISKMREDSEKNLVIARAEALNVAQATFVQVKGRSQADIDWKNAGSNEAKYLLLLPYLSYAEGTMVGGYLPSGYTVIFNPAINDMKKANLYGPDNVQIKY